MFKLIVAGGREFNDSVLLAETLSKALINISYSNVELVCGGARGADSLGEQWAKANGVAIKYFIPDWDGLGKSAGHVRNRQMGDYANAAVIYWDGASKGSKGMLDYMNKLGKPVRVIRY